MENTRRGFLKSVAGTVLAVSVGKSAKAKKEVVVGAHPWVYAATQLKYDIYPILDRIFSDMKYAGMEGIELMHTALYPDDAVERINALREKYDLPVIGTSYSAAMWDREKRNEIIQDAEKVITRLELVGGKTLGTSVGRTKEIKTEEQLDAQAETLRKIIQICEEHGVQLNLHNHTYEVENELYDLKGTLKRILDVKLGPDLDWLVQAGVDPLEFLKTYGDRIVFLHLRDQKADKTWVEAMGEGDMDYEKVGETLREIGFSGYAVIELAHPREFEITRPLRESLKMSREFVKKTLGY